FDASWTRLEQNDLWTALTGDVRGRAGRPANIVWRIFNDDSGRVRHPFPDNHKASLLADLRDVASRYPADRELSDMITALRRSNPEFAHLWELSTVAHHGNERKTIDHPDAGGRQPPRPQAPPPRRPRAPRAPPGAPARPPWGPRPPPAPRGFSPLGS